MYNSERFYRPSGKLLRLSQKVYKLLAISSGFSDSCVNISGSDNGAWARTSPFIFNMFDSDEGQPLFSFPVRTDKEFIPLCLERAKSIGSCNIGWSGGIDSTFILACFAYENIPVRVVTVHNRLVRGRNEKIYFKPKLYKFVDRNFGIKSILPPSLRIGANGSFEYVVDKNSDIPIVTAAWADALFFPNQRLKGDMSWSFAVDRNGSYIRKVSYHENKFVPFEKYLTDSGLFSESEIDYLFSLSGKFGYPLDSRNRIARFLYFISAMPSFLFDSTLMFMPKLESFFCTQDFVNLACFKYWDNPNNSGFYPRDKKIEIDFIRKVFGSDFGVASNW